MFLSPEAVQKVPRQDNSNTVILVRIFLIRSFSKRHSIDCWFFNVVLFPITIQLLCTLYILLALWFAFKYNVTNILVITLYDVFLVSEKP